MISVRLQHALGSFRLEAEFSSERSALGLWGPSGSGKTTTLNLIAGLLRPDEGRIEMNGEVWFDRQQGIWTPPHKRRIGYLFQEPRLFPHMSVRSNLLYGAEKGEGSKIPSAALIELLDIGPLLQRKPRFLSGGEARRVALGRALLSNPSILLLDEPMAGLDAGLRGRLLPYIQEVHAQFHIPYILVSHWASDMLALAEEAVAFSNGRVLGVGDPLETVLGSADAWDRDEVAPINHWSVPVVSSAKDGAQEVEVGSQRIVIPDCGLEVGATARLAIGANEIVLSTLGEIPDGFSVRNRLRVRISELREFHDSVLAIVRDEVPNPLLIQLTRGSARELGLAPGMEAWALIKTQSIRIE